MNIQKIITPFDRWQRKHRFVAFPVAVIKKYSEDNGGYQAGLLTYYGFLSLFPLLLVLVTILQLVFQGDPDVQHQISENVGHFVPLLGSQLEANIHSIHKTGLGLAVGLLFTIYGTRGAADAFRFAIDNIWQIPKKERTGFPKNILQSFMIIICGTVGFLATALVSGLTSIFWHGTISKIIINILGFVILTAVLGYMFRIATAGRIPAKRMFFGATIAAFAIQLLLSVGGLVISHQLKHLDSVYGIFAIVLGLIFWIYLMSQIVMYAAEIDAVRHRRLWPRSLTGQNPTEADRKAVKLTV